MTPFVMRRATNDDLQTVMSLLNARISWLQQRGSDQWSTRDFEPIMTKAIAYGDTWIMFEHETAVASMTMSTLADADFWSGEERTTPALYLSKLTTHPDVAGRGIGALLIDWANNYAHSWGVSTLRWDVWRTNHELQRYYKQLGRHIRTVDMPGRWSGALYEVSFKASPDLNYLVATAAGQPHRMIVDSSLTKPAAPDDLDNTDAYSPHLNRPEHAHHVTDFRVSPLDTEAAREPRELLIRSDDRNGVLLYDSGDGWRAKTYHSHAVTSWPRLRELQPGRLHKLMHQVAGEPCAVALISETL